MDDASTPQERAFESAATVFRGASWKGPVATAVAYAIGAQIGFHLRFPPATTSILWPPNAILTTALLVVDPKKWWICLLANGVAKDAAAHIFEPFYTTKSNGMGMGLSIAKSIVESHHGSIWLAKSAHQGARFEFALPSHEARP
jgi:integral membrane sensor domain MASE1